MYKANDSIYKQKIRKILQKKVETTVKGNTKKYFLSLCNTSFELESELLKKYNGEFHCYEIDKNVYAEAKKLAPQGVKLFNENVYSAPELDSHPYSFVWLDLCSSYTEETINNIIEFVSKISFKTNAILAITLNRKRGLASKDIKFNQYYPCYKDKGFAKHISGFINGKVTDIERVQYTCKDICTTGASMNLFIFTIKK